MLYKDEINETYYTSYFQVSHFTIIWGRYPPSATHLLGRGAAEPPTEKFVRRISTVCLARC